MRRRSRLVMVLSVLGLVGCHRILAERQPVGTCGDGVTQEEMGEECDGAPVDGFTCSPTCTLERCGNGRKDRGEECDLGLANDNGGDCTLDCKQARCGDGFTKTRGKGLTEVCDDGNNDNGDGCNPDCSLRGRVAVIGGELGGRGIRDGTGSAARFSGVWGMAAGNDYLYLTDRQGCSIRRLQIATGLVETIAGTSGSCNLVADGPGDKATFSENPMALALTGQHLYVGARHLLRRIDLSSSTFDVATCAKINIGSLNQINALVPASSGEALYVATNTSVHRVKLPCRCDQFSTAPDRCAFEVVAGGQSMGHVDGIGTSARFGLVYGMALEASGESLVLVDNNTVRRIDLKTTQVTTIAGDPDAPLGHVDAVGKAARFGLLWGIAPSAHGLIVVDEYFAQGAVAGLGWSSIRQVHPATGQTTTVAGTYGVASGPAGEADGFGHFARFIGPRSIARWQDVVFVGEKASVRALSLTTGQVATAAGALVRDFTHYEGGAVTAGSGKLYLPTGFRELIETNVAASTPPRQIGLCKTYAGATSRVDAVAIRGSKLFVADSGMPGICQVDLNSGAATPVYTAKVGQGVNQYMEWGPTGMAFDGKDLFMVASRTGEIIRFDPAAPGSKPTTVSVKTPLRRPWGIVALDGALYVTSRDDNVVVRIDPKSGSVHTIGDGLPATRDGQGGKASLCHPLGLATDGAYLYVGEAFCPTRDGQFHGNAIRQIDIATEEVTTLVGPGGDSVVVPGSGSRAGVNFPAALTHDATTRALYVADSWENVLLKVD